MDDRALVDGWLRSLGHQLGWPLRMDDQGVSAVGHASGIDCAIEVPAEGGCVVLRAPLLDWYPDQLESQALAAYCLQRQFLGRGTGAASFGIDLEDAELVLWQVTPLRGMDESSFHQLLATFLDQAVRCLDDLEAHCQGVVSEDRGLADTPLARLADASDGRPQAPQPRPLGAVLP